jgi:hypothetical protein
MTAVLVDTNVLVYAHDRGEPEKQARAIEVLARLEDNHNGRLSVQMLAEFFSVTRAVSRPSSSYLRPPNKSSASFRAGRYCPSRPRSSWRLCVVCESTSWRTGTLKFGLPRGSIRFRLCSAKTSISVQPWKACVSSILLPPISCWKTGREVKGRVEARRALAE